MTIQYSSNFDSEAVGTLPTGWVEKKGTWTVTTSNPSSGANALAPSTDADGDAVLYTGISAIADMQVETRCKAVLRGTKFPQMCQILRMDSAYQNGYLILLSGVSGTGVTINAFKRSSGSYSAIGSTGLTIAISAGDVIAVKSSIVGSAISVKVWNATTGSEPVENSYSTTNSVISAAGYAGLYYAIDGTTGSIFSADDFVIDDLVASSSGNAPGGTGTSTGSGSGGTASAGSGVNNAYAAANILFSPYNWLAGSTAKTINAGAYFKTIFGGTACSLTFDMTGIASPVPQISYRIDGYGAWTTVDVAATVVLSVPAKTADYASKGGHYLEVIVKSMTETQPRWTTQSTAVVLTGIVLDTGKSLSKPPALPLNGLYFGDSITEGVRTVNSTDTYDTDRNDAAQSWSLLSAQLIGAECGNVGFGGAGFNTAGSGSVPAINSSYGYLWSGQARSFSPAPDYIVINEGTNDSVSVVTNATALLNGLIAATPKTTKIIVLRPFNGNRVSEIVSAIAACSDPARITYVDTTGYFTTANSADSLHPYGNENLFHIASLIAAQIRSKVAPQRGARTLRSVTVNLVDAANAPRASLSGLKWAFFDQATPDAMTVTADQGTAETTDGSGVLTVPVYTTLASGGVGWLVVTDSDGTTSMAHKAFSGPVTVA